MIPVRSVEDGRAPALAELVADERERIEPGLRELSRGVPLVDGAVVDLLAADADGRVVLVLVEDGPSEPLFERAAAALLGYRGAAALLARLHPLERIDEREAPRLVLVARRFSEAVAARVGLLRGPAARCIECAVVASATGFELLVTARGSTSGGVPGGAPAVRGGAAQEPCSKPARRRKAPRGLQNGARAAEPGVPHRIPRRLLDEAKRRLLRLSPEVSELADGDVWTFQVGGNLLATVTVEGEALAIAAGDESVAPLRVENADELGEAMDSVFERFFNLASTRRRLEAGGGRPRDAGNGQAPQAAEPRAPRPREQRVQRELDASARR